MKVLHVITGLNNGGAEAVLYRLSASDQTMGNQHHVVSLMGRGIYADQLERADVEVTTLDMPRGRITLSGLIGLYRVIKRVRPDVVQTWMYHADLIGGVVARVAGVKAIAWGIRHANHDQAHNSRVTLLTARICALLSRWVPRKIVSCSISATTLHQDLGYRREKFVTIPNGYALDRLKLDGEVRSAIRDELGIAPADFVLGMVARFDPQKDHRNLISALAQLKRLGKPFVCLLAGVGMDVGNEELVAQLDAVRLTDYVKLLGPRSDIPRVMNALDVHVLSSLGEAFPNVLAEAMACGAPCVTTNVGDAALIVGEHGWVVAPQNAAALAEAILQARSLCENNFQAWEVLRHACRAHIMENFDLDQMRQRYCHVWERCLESSCGS